MRRKGFTLLEISIALLIVGLFLSIISFQEGGFLQKSRLHSQATMVKALIEFAKEEAVNRCQSLEIVFERGSLSLIRRNEKEEVIKKLTLDEGFFFETEGERLYVDELGRVSGKIPELSYGEKRAVFKIEKPLLGIVTYEIR